MKINLKQKKGITLIALVITIVVLLILAGVTIAMLTGENGILGKATAAKNKNDEASVEEKIRLAVMYARMNTNGDTSINLVELEKELNKNFNNDVSINKKGENEALPWRVTNNGYMFEISENGEITRINGIALDKSNIKLLQGESKTITAELTQGVTGTITWTSNNANVTVTGNDKTAQIEVKENATGTATITAKIEGTEYSATCKVNIVVKVESISADDLEIEVGAEKEIKIKTTPSNNIEDLTYTYAVDNSNVTIDNRGKVKGVKVGTSTITIKGTGISGTKVVTTCTITILKPEDTRTVMEQATEAKPEGATIDASTNENTGIVMIDSKQNEWVWIEVPSKVFTSATSSIDYENIKADLIAYASDYRRSWTDEWYSGCGLEQEEYNTNYKKMLSSIYTNKGFYIGRYEAGIEGSNTDTSLARYSRTEITNSSPKAVSKKDMIPYNFVYCSDAQQLASEMSTGNKTSSLMYGIQWDLVCKFLEVKGNWDTSSNTAQYYIKSNSTSWGNHIDSSITLSRGKYNIDSSSSASTWTPFNTDTDNYVTSSKTNSNTSYKQLLTTGASEDTNKMNIYDFAGNEWEWTLEQATDNYDDLCSMRGGIYNGYGFRYPASSANRVTTINSYDNVGFRPSLY